MGNGVGGVGLWIVTLAVGSGVGLAVVVVTKRVGLAVDGNGVGLAVVGKGVG